ncbi:MAG: AEC family transporter [Kiritimatiellaeota bacterium]|nr:AEC family transporter [Kiritimatiellota bacterium]
MADSFLLVARQVGILFILIGIGFACNKARLLTEAAVKGLTELVLFIVTPCVLVTAFQRGYEARLLAGLGRAFLFTAASMALCAAAAHLLVRDNDARRASVLRFSVVFSNCGFMAIPLQKALLGDEGVFYGAACIALFNMLLWTYGLLLMGGAAGRQGVSARKVFLNPGMLGCAVGLLLFLTRVTLPGMVHKPMAMMSELNTPVPMIIIGYYLAEANLRRVATDWRAGMVALLRLVVMPLVALGLFCLAGSGEPKMVMACMIAAAAPVAAATTMFSAKFGQDTLLSVEMVSFTTLLSILTMPLVLGLALRVFPSAF